MKKLYCAAVLALLFSCSSSDDNQPSIITPPAVSLQGQWKLVSKVQNGHTTAANYCEDNYNYYQFGADSGAIVGQYEMYDIGSTHYCRQYTGTGSYSVVGNILTYTQSEFIWKYNIVSANSLTIKLEKFWYHTSQSGDVTIPQNDRVIEICNKQ